MGLDLFLDLLGDLSFSESVVESSVDIFQVSASASTWGSSSLGLGGPVESSSDGGSFLLNMISSSSSNSAQNVGPRAVISQPPDSVQHEVNELLANGVVAPGVVVGSVLLPADHLLRVEQLTVGPRPDLVHHGGLQVDKDCPGNMLARAGLREESRKRIIFWP